MSHFAEIDKNNIVIRVLVGEDKAPNEGYGWFVENLGGTWIKTSYNANIRKNYAGIGFTYDSDLDAFIPPKPYDSWILNEKTCQWQSPIEHSNDGKFYIWNEEEKNWLLANNTTE
jgi:hypothetical protein